jgi:nicotinamide-nucleotide amidase
MTYGEGESNIAERIEDFENSLPTHIKLAYLPSFGRVRLRLSAKGPEKQALEQELHLKVEELKTLVADIYVGLDDNNSLEKSIGQILTNKGETISTAESLTGGKIASSLVSIPGSSKYFLGSIVAYQEEVKVEFLNVSKESIQENTTVSAEVAEQMAKGALEKFNTDYGIAVTGNAGPTTDNNDKTVGLVYIAIATKEAVKSFEFNFGQPREKVINKTVNKSLELLLKELR